MDFAEASMTDKQTEKPEDLKLYRTTGMALMDALNAQYQFADELTTALVASGALSREAAAELLQKTARRIERSIVKPKTEAAAKSAYRGLVVERNVDHAKKLSELGGKIKKSPS